MSDIYVDDVGTEIIISFEEDISGATEYFIEMKKPNNTVVRLEDCLLDGSTIRYNFKEGDLNIVGEYKLQPVLRIGGWFGRGSTVSFKVTSKWN